MPEHPILTAARELPLCQLEAVIDGLLLDAMEGAAHGQAGARRTVIWAELLGLRREARTIIGQRDASRAPLALEIPPLHVTLSPLPSLRSSACPSCGSRLVPDPTDSTMLCCTNYPACDLSPMGRGVPRGGKVVLTMPERVPPPATIDAGLRRARAWAEAQDCPTDRGWALYHLGDPQGWSEELPDPKQWADGTIAYYLPGGLVAMRSTATQWVPAQALAEDEPVLVHQDMGVRCFADRCA